MAVIDLAIKKNSLSSPNPGSPTASALSINSSLVGRGGLRAPPGNQFLIDVFLRGKMCRKRFAMLKNRNIVPRAFFMQIKPPLHENTKTAVTPPIQEITAKIRCLDPGFEGLASL